MSLHFPGSWLEILVVASDPAHARLYREGLRTESGSVSVVGGAAEVGARLRGGGDGEPAIRPNVVLLDVDVPHAEWREIARAIVDAGLTGPIIAVGWQDGAMEALADGATHEKKGVDLSRLVRRAIVEKRTQDERLGALRNGTSSADAVGTAEGALMLTSGGVAGPGSHAGVGRLRTHLTLREDTGAGLLGGLAAVRGLVDRLGPARPAASWSDHRESAPVHPNELIRQTVQRYEGIAAERGIHLLEIEEDYAPFIACDGPALVTALGILTGYVLHFGRGGGKAWVSVDSGEGDAVGFGVSCGDGIAEDHLPLVADAFAAVAPILDAHRATLRFSSSWGRRLGFYFTLPADLSRSDASPSDGER